MLLYELLTGRRPYRLTSRAVSEIMRVVCESEPLRPSMAVTRPVEPATPTLPTTIGRRRAIHASRRSAPTAAQSRR